jgi:hypothetical protein
MEISGYRLDKIFYDAAIGKLGTLEVCIPADNKAAYTAECPVITSILHVPMSAVSASDLECSDES